jgi:hypothetical protein
MAERRDSNSISIGGDAAGTFVAGDHNVVGAVNPATPSASSGLVSCLGFVFDVVGYGGRSAEQKSDIHERLRALVDHVLADLAIAGDDVIDDGGSGDSLAVFLPAGVDYTRVLPALLTAAASRLARDNDRYRDRMRLRMAAGTGLLGKVGPTGLTGELIIDLNRLVDSAALRKAMDAHPESDLIVLVGNALYDDVIRPGYLDRAAFTRVEVTMKEFTAPAWLYVT